MNLRKELRLLLGLVQSPLEKHVARWMVGYARNYECGLNGVMEDLFNHGCQSGMVSHLVYYRETGAFYQKYKEEIWELALTRSEHTGQKPLEMIAGFSGAGAIGSVNQFENLMAWYGFEETARNLLLRLQEKMCQSSQMGISPEQDYRIRL